MQASPIASGGLIGPHARHPLLKRCCGQAEEGATQGLQGWQPRLRSHQGRSQTWLFLFLLSSSCTGYALVKILPRPLLLALCPRTVGGAPASLVGRPGRHAPPFQPSPPYHSLDDRCIVLGDKRQLDASLPFPAAPMRGLTTQPAHPAQPGGLAWMPRSLSL